MTTEDHLDHSTFARRTVEHVRRGTPVFPVGANKRPLEVGGFHRATTDRDQIERWTREHPAAGVGLPTGEITGCVVLDVDVKTDGPESLRDLEAAQGSLPDTVRVLTPAGGTHLYFAYPPNVDKVPNSASKVGRGLDVRGDGGYVVAPPSPGYQWDAGAHPDDRDLAPVPDWLLALMLAPPERTSSVSRAEPIREGERNSTLASLAGTLRRPGMTAEAIEAALLVENERRCDPPLPDDEVRKIARSISRYPAADGEHGDAAPAIAPVPFPVAVIPAPLRGLIEEGAKAHGVPPDFIAVPLLALAGGAMGRSHGIEIKPGFVEFPHLWVAIVAPPGTGKTPAQATARRAIDELQDDARDRYEQDLADYEAAQAELAEWHASKKGDRGPKPEISAKPRIEAVFTTDATTEAIAAALQVSPGFTFIRDELVGWVKSYDAYRSGRGGDRQTWLSMWSAQPIKVDRKGADPIYVTKPVVSVVGGVQPAMLAQLAEEAGRQDGFIERILFAYPAAHPAPWTEAFVRKATHEAVIEVFRALRSSGAAEDLEGERVFLSADAKELWVSWYNENQGMIDGMPGLLAGVYAKLPTQLARLALILHGWTYPKDPAGHRVSAETMSAAIDVAEYFRAHAHRVMAAFGSPAITKRGGLVARCYRVLAKTPGEWVRSSTLHRALGASVPATERESALQELQRMDMVEHRVVPAEGGRGRPAKEWRAVTTNAENADNPGGALLGALGAFVAPGVRGAAVSAERIIAEMRAAGIQLSVRGDKIRAWPASALPDELRARIVTEKDAILDALLAQCQVCAAPVDAYLPDGTPVCDRHNLPLVQAAAAAGGRVLSDAEARACTARGSRRVNLLGRATNANVRRATMRERNA